MIELPKECYVGRFIPKKKFYENIGISNTIKDDFVNKIEKITWLYKLSPDTTGISKTDNVNEIEIFEIELKEKCLPNTVIKTITKAIPYKILFQIKYNDNVCYAIKVDDIYYSDWNSEVNLKLNSLNLELLYESIVKNIIKEETNDKNFESIIETRNKKDLLEKDIQKIKAKIKNEKQFDKKVELNNYLNKLLNELEMINNE